MTSSIRHRSSTIAGHVPSSLLDGELAINEIDALLFFKNAAGAVAARALSPEPGILIVSGEVTNVATLDFNIAPASIGTFKGFLLRLGDIEPVGTTSNLMLRFGTSGGINSGSSDYEYVSLREIDGTWRDMDNADNSFIMTYEAVNTSSASNWEILISGNDPTPTMLRSALWRGVNRVNYPAYPASNSTYTYGCGRRLADIDLTQLRMLFSSGNIAKAKYSLVGFA